MYTNSVPSALNRTRAKTEYGLIRKHCTTGKWRSSPLNYTRQTAELEFFHSHQTVKDMYFEYAETAVEG